MHHSLLTVLALTVFLGVFGQVLASLTRIPAIVFLLLLGVAAGPFGLNLVNPDDLGPFLDVVVSGFVAIILFEGALTLRPDVLRQALSPVRRLVTVGALLTFVGTALLAKALGRLPWSLSFLYASLIVVTGPTVVGPILRRVHLLPRLHAILKSESILIEPVGVLLAITVFQCVVGTTSDDWSWGEAAVGFITRIGAGVLVGGAVGLAAAATARLRLFHKRGSEHLVNLGALGVALGTFVLAEALRPEAGVMAVVVAGLILAAMPIPFRAELEKFKDHATTLGVAVLFILLAAKLNLALVLEAHWRETAVLAGLILVVRPVSVWIATIGTALSWREKAFLGMFAPRGILAAAMASYCAAQLLRSGGDADARRVESLVFFTIAVTVCLQGGYASLLARLLRVRPKKPQGVLLVGVNEWSLALAHELRSWDRFVAFLDSNAAGCARAIGEGFVAYRGDATDRDSYRRLDLSPVGLLVAMTPNDAVNTLVCDAASSWLGGDNVLQVVSERPGKVRLGGRRAMPTARSHAEVVRLLKEKRVYLDTETCQQPTRIAAQLATSKGVMLPLLVLDAGRISIAVEGQACAANAIIVGFVPAAVREESEDMNGMARATQTN